MSRYGENYVIPPREFSKYKPEKQQTVEEFLNEGGIIKKYNSRNIFMPEIHMNTIFMFMYNI
jgi:hypothetical protein